MTVYQCEDSMESIFTAIYQAYEEKQRPEDTKISINEEPFLFADYRKIQTDVQKAEKVSRTIRRLFGEEDYYHICLALCANDEEKAQSVYQTIALGLLTKPQKGHLLDSLANQNVHEVFRLARSASREECHYRGFLRFEELEGGILYGKIAPKNHLLPFLMPHFADRYPREHFLIYDRGRELFGVHPSGRQWYLLQGDSLAKEAEFVRLSEKEREYQELFRYFCHKIAIAERQNKELQQNLLPLRFRKDMIEFQ